MMDLDSSLAKAVSIEIYEFRISRFDFQPKLMCMCRVSFLITPDIYIRIILKVSTYLLSDHTRRINANNGLMSYSF